MTVFIDPDAFHAMTEPGDLAKHLEGLKIDVLAMQRTILSKVTRLHWAYSDLGEEDHAAVGPDAFDIVLRQLARGGASMATVMAAEAATGASPGELSLTGRRSGRRVCLGVRRVHSVTALGSAAPCQSLLPVLRSVAARQVGAKFCKNVDENDNHNTLP